MTFAALAFEILVGLLIAAAAVMCWRVDRRLSALRNGQDGLKETIAALNDAVDRARVSLTALDRAAKENGASLRQEVERAQKLTDELRFLSADGDMRADRLASRARPARPEPARPAHDRDLAGEADSRRRHDALKALR